MPFLQKWRATPPAPAPLVAPPAPALAPAPAGLPAPLGAAGDTPDRAPEGAGAEDWSRIWFAMLAHDWRSLALLPASARGSALPVAERFAACARAYHSGPVRLVDAHAVAPDEVQAHGALLADALAGHERLLLVLPSPLARAAAVPLARAADAALLVVPLGQAGVREARRAVAAVGPAHFLGSVTVRDR